MHIKNTVELLYLSLMLRWENTAPEDGKQAELDGTIERNTQISRMVYLLRKVATGSVENTFTTLSRYSRRNDGESYISKNMGWMENPKELSGGWYFEGGTSLIQKHEILQGLSKIGLSATFSTCADDFVAGESIKGYLPSEEEQDEIIAKIKETENIRSN